MMLIRGYTAMRDLKYISCSVKRAMTDRDVSSSSLKDIVIGAGAAFDCEPARGASTFYEVDASAFAYDGLKLALDRDHVVFGMQWTPSLHRKGREGRKVNGQATYTFAKAG